jgi:hypothetical protein
MVPENPQSIQMWSAATSRAPVMLAGRAPDVP